MLIGSGNSMHHWLGLASRRDILIRNVLAAGSTPAPPEYRGSLRGMGARMTGKAGLGHGPLFPVATGTPAQALHG